MGGKVLEGEGDVLRAAEGVVGLGMVILRARGGVRLRVDKLTVCLVLRDSMSWGGPAQ
jgi:hypothetical protein